MLHLARGGNYPLAPAADCPHSVRTGRPHGPWPSPLPPRCSAPAEVALLPVLFAVTLFVGAALLFLVQPLVGKLLLPLVGGSPGVWNTCMVFFQAVLLGGYLYAHRSTGQLGVRRQALVHLMLLAAVLVSFKAALAATGSPVPVVASLLPDDQDYPVLGLVALLAVAVGIPFFVLSTTSP